MRVPFASGPFRHRSTVPVRTRLLPLIAAAIAFAATAIVPSPATAQDAAAAADDLDDLDFDGLYFKATDLMRAQDFAQAKIVLEKAIESVGEFGWEDYGKGFGGLYFDYGTCLLRLNLVDEALDAFKTCANSDELGKDSKVPSTNKRKNIALFEWGFCEDRTGNPEEALKLYQRYIDIPPDAAELELVRSALALRLGTAYLHAGKLEEGTKEIQRIFDNKVEWKVNSQFLMQGLLELGLGWVDKATKNPEQAAGVEKSAHLFLDQQQESLSMSPFDKQRFGMVERLRKLGYDSGNAGMNTLALRYYSMIPTAAEVLDDLKMRASVYGERVPAIYADLIKKQEELLSGDDPPQVELLRLVSASWDRLGNRHAARAIYSHLAQNYPKSEKRAEILHEAARFSTMLSDYSSAQYYGEIFMKEMPQDHKLRNNVATFMLQSLFTARKYDLVMEIADQVRARYEAGADERELPDFLYGGSLYYSGRHEEAQAELDAFVAKYPESGNLEAALYYQASNQVVLGEFEKASDLLDSFLGKFEKSKFLDLALYDRATCHFNAEQYDLCVEKTQRLIDETPESQLFDRAHNMLGDAYDAQSYDAEEDEQELELLENALAAYRKGAAVSAEKESVPIGAESIAKATDVAIRLEKWEDAVALYDSFFPTYAGSSWEPQISVYSLDALTEVGRVEDGLTQIEKMIIVMGGLGPDEQDIDLLRRAIGSYSEASVEHRGAEKTIATFDSFPGLAPDDQALLTWLQIQKVIVLQELRKAAEKDSPEYAAIDGRINEVFEKLQSFDISNLSDFALQQVVLYLKEDQPFLAKRYAEELLNRDAPDFKVPAEFALGEIEMRGTDEAQLRSARERFLRVVNTYKDPVYIPEAHLHLGRIAIKTEDWAEARDNFRIINRNKKWLNKDQRAESNVGYGISAEELGDMENAKKAYSNVLAVYTGVAQWSSVALERAFNLTWAQVGEDRELQIKAYAFLRRMNFIMQKLDAEGAEALTRMRLREPEIRTEIGLTPEEEAAIDAEIGISQPDN